MQIVGGGSKGNGAGMAIRLSNDIFCTVVGLISVTRNLGLYIQV